MLFVYIFKGKLLCSVAYFISYTQFKNDPHFVQSVNLAAVRTTVLAPFKLLLIGFHLKTEALITGISHSQSCEPERVKNIGFN